MDRRIRGILFLVIITLSMSACTTAYQEVECVEPIEEVLSQSSEIVKIYEAHRLFMEGKPFIKVIGLEPSLVRDIEVYSMRDEEDLMTYTLDVTTEVPIAGHDVKCMKQKYEVRMEKQNECVVKSITPTSPFVINAISQVPYQNEISQAEQNKIKELLKILLHKEKSFFRNYERSWLEGYASWVQFLSGAPAFYTGIKTREENYKENYSLNLSPYSLEDEQIHWDMDKISFEVEQPTTKKIHFVRVNIPAEVLRDYHNKLYYNYEYLVVLNEGAVTSIKLIRKEPL